MAGYLGSVPVPQATQHRETFTATAAQTSFATAGYTPQFVDVYLNGVHLSPADVTATNGSDVVLTACLVNDIVDVVSYTPFEVANQTFTGTTAVDVATVGGTLGVTGVLTATAGAIFNGGLTTDGALITGGTKLLFRDSGLFLNSSTNGQLDIDADTELELTAPTIQLVASTKVDLDGNLDVSGTALVTGVLTTTAATVFNGGFSTKAVGTIKHTDGVDNISLASTSTGGVLNVRNSSGTAVITLDGRNSLVTVGNGLTLTDGNLTVASGHGISFAATADGGATTPSELLDDYEEGTYTATVTPSSSGSIGLSSGFGSYTKIGNLVTVNASCSTNAISSPVGYFKLNLPFTCNNTNQNGRAAASFYLDGMASGNNVSDFIGLTVENTTECRVYLGDSNGAVSDSAQQVDASAYILISVTYRTA